MQSSYCIQMLYVRRNVSPQSHNIYFSSSSIKSSSCRLRNISHVSLTEPSFQTFPLLNPHFHLYHEKNSSSHCNIVFLHTSCKFQYFTTPLCTGSGAGGLSKNSLPALKELAALCVLRDESPSAAERVVKHQAKMRGPSTKGRSASLRHD